MKKFFTIMRYRYYRWWYEKERQKLVREMDLCRDNEAELKTLGAMATFCAVEIQEYTDAIRYLKTGTLSA